MAGAASATGHREVREAIRSRTFAPVYYFHGPEEYLKEETARHLVDAAVDPSTRAFNYEQLRGADSSAESLGSLLATPPIMAERRVVLLRDPGALKKDARAALDRYLSRPAPDVVLVLLAPAGAKEDRLLLARATAVEFDALSGARLAKWITHYATTELHCEITDDAAALLQAAVGSELAALQTELDKLASFASGTERRVIDETAVSAVVGVRRGETMSDLLDAVAQRDVRRALALVPVVLQQPKTSAVQLVMALATQTLALAWGRAMRDRGTSAGRLAGEYYSFLKEGGGYTGRSWGEATRAWAGAVDRWTAPALDEALDALLAADIALKESRLSSEEQLLSSLVLTLAHPAGAPRRAA